MSTYLGWQETRVSPRSQKSENNKQNGIHILTAIRNAIKETHAKKECTQQKAWSKTPWVLKLGKAGWHKANSCLFCCSRLQKVPEVLYIYIYKKKIKSCISSPSHVREYGSRCCDALHVEFLLNKKIFWSLLCQTFLQFGSPGQLFRLLAFSAVCSLKGFDCSLLYLKEKHTHVKQSVDFSFCVPQAPQL